MKMNFIKAIDMINKDFEDAEIEITLDGDTIITEINKSYNDMCKMNFIEYDFLKDLYIAKSLELKAQFPLLNFAFAFSDFEKNIVYTGIMDGHVIYDAFDRKDVSKKD